MDITSRKPRLRCVVCLNTKFEEDEQENMICTACGTLSQDFLSQSANADEEGMGNIFPGESGGSNNRTINASVKLLQEQRSIGNRERMLLLNAYLESSMSQSKSYNGSQNADYLPPSPSPALSTSTSHAASVTMQSQDDRSISMRQQLHRNQSSTNTLNTTQSEKEGRNRPNAAIDPLKVKVKVEGETNFKVSRVSASQPNQTNPFVPQSSSSQGLIDANYPFLLAYQCCLRVLCTDFLQLIMGNPYTNVSLSRQVPTAAALPQADRSDSSMPLSPCEQLQHEFLTFVFQCWEDYLVQWVTYDRQTRKHNDLYRTILSSYPQYRGQSLTSLLTRGNATIVENKHRNFFLCADQGIENALPGEPALIQDTDGNGEVTSSKPSQARSAAASDTKAYSDPGKKTFKTFQEIEVAQALQRLIAQRPPFPSKLLLLGFVTLACRCLRWPLGPSDVAGVVNNGQLSYLYLFENLTTAVQPAPSSSSSADPTTRANPSSANHLHAPYSQFCSMLCAVLPKLTKLHLRILTSVDGNMSLPWRGYRLVSSAQVWYHTVLLARAIRRADPKGDLLGKKPVATVNSQPNSGELYAEEGDMRPFESVHDESLRLPGLNVYMMAWTAVSALGLPSVVWNQVCQILILYETKEKSKGDSKATQKPISSPIPLSVYFQTKEEILAIIVCAIKMCPLWETWELWTAANNTCKQAVPLVKRPRMLPLRYRPIASDKSYPSDHRSHETADTTHAPAQRIGT